MVLRDVNAGDNKVAEVAVRQDPALKEFIIGTVIYTLQYQKVGISCIFVRATFDK